MPRLYYERLNASAEFTDDEYMFLQNQGQIKYNNGTDQVLHHYGLVDEQVVKVGESRLIPYVEEVIDVDDDIVLED